MSSPQIKKYKINEYPLLSGVGALSNVSPAFYYSFALFYHQEAQNSNSPQLYTPNYQKAQQFYQTLLKLDNDPIYQNYYEAFLKEWEEKKEKYEGD